MRLRLSMSDRARAYIEQIVHQMVLRFGITRDEAVGRVNQAWGHLDHIADTDLIFHQSPPEWAGDIYYGRDSGWWNGEDGLRPVPYEPEA